MSKHRQRQKARTAAPVPSKPWYQRAWVAAVFVGGVVTTTVSIIGSILANGPTYIANAEKMPGELERVSNKFLSWLYEDGRWNGYFGTSPEAYADIEDLNLAKADSKLTVHLTTERGYISGEIVSRALCESRPFPDYLLLEGRAGLSGKRATLVAWDLVGGKRQNYFTFSIEQDVLGVLTLRHEEGHPGALPNPARVALYPDLKIEEQVNKALRDVCKDERKIFLDRLHEQRGEVSNAGRNAVRYAASGASR